MEGLRYLAAEIQERRQLLHGFLREPKFIGDMVAKASRNPEEYRYIKNGEIEFISPQTCLYQDPANPAKHSGVSGHVFPDLTFEGLVSHLEEFYDDTKGSMLTMPITPFKDPPAGYKVRLELTYVLGKGGYGAYLWAALDSPYTKQRFDIQICHDFLPKDYRQSLGYQSWKRIRRGVSSLRTREDNSDIKGKELIPYRIKIDEKTKPGMIWTQLLLCALSQGYLSWDDRVYEELSVLVPHIDGSVRGPSREDVFHSILEHFRTKRLYPYAPSSFGAYRLRLKSGFEKNISSKYYQATLSLTGIPKVASETEIPKQTIYRLIKQGKVQARKDQGYLEVTDNGMAELNRLSQEKEKRSNIFQLAGLKGKNKQATKKWLQRHRDMPNSELREQMEHWLGISPGRRPQRP